VLQGVAPATMSSIWRCPPASASTRFTPERRRSHRGRLVGGTLLFVAGFGTVFVLLGIGAGGLGRQVRQLSGRWRSPAGRRWWCWGWGWRRRGAPGTTPGGVRRLTILDIALGSVLPDSMGPNTCHDEEQAAQEDRQLGSNEHARWQFWMRNLKGAHEDWAPGGRSG
jgi:hypothetical protein